MEMTDADPGVGRAGPPLKGKPAKRPTFARTSLAGHRQSRLLKTVLKREIRNRGMRYKDIAEQLGVSVMTIKRYLNSDRVPVEVLEDIGACIGLGLLELAEVAKADDGRDAQDLELQQETALASEPALALVRLLVYSGMSVAEILHEYKVDESELVGYLARLDRLKLIELLPGNRVRIRGPRHVEWMPGGPIRQTIQNDIRNNFVKWDFANTNQFFGYETARLTQASVGQLEDHMRGLVRQMRILHQIDQSASGEEKEWYTMLVAQRVTSWSFPLRNGELSLPRIGTAAPYPDTLLKKD